MTESSGKLGIIAGGGPLPRRVVEHCLASKRPFYVAAFEGHTEAVTCEGVPHRWFRLGAVGELLRALQAQRCEEVVMIGPIARPSLSTLKLDLRAVRLLARLGTATAQGDNALLALLVEELEREGFRVLGADDLLDDVTTPNGVLGKAKPDEIARRDIEIGCRAAQQIGAADIGQAVIVQQGIVLGVEAIEGTDALIERCGKLQRDGPGGVLVKLKKPGQEARADLPTIGPRTIQNLAAAGLRGVALESDGSLIIDRRGVVGEADRLGIFIVGIGAP